jgi:hypothetical protein
MRQKEKESLPRGLELLFFSIILFFYKCKTFFLMFQIKAKKVSD